jgi:hypothetical protein
MKRHLLATVLVLSTTLAASPASAGEGSVDPEWFRAVVNAMSSGTPATATAT